ncbi:MAG: SURF1 family protein [Halieaceae bacterium]
MSKVKLQLDLEWRTTVFTALLLPLLIYLGFWQLQRAEDKAVLAAAFEQRQAAAPVMVSAATMAEAPESLAYLPVRIQGEFVAGRDILLDNRLQGGKFGYEVVSPLVLSSGEAVVLVNRGWIAGDAARRSLPQVQAPSGPVDITGHIYVSPGQPYLLAEQELSGAWPKVLQALEMDKLRPVIEQATKGGAMLPYRVRIDAGQTGALQVDWQIINVSPEKHRGYAVQWFCMAAALLMLFVLRSSNLWQVMTGKVENSR